MKMKTGINVVAKVLILAAFVALAMSSVSKAQDPLSDQTFAMNLAADLSGRFVECPDVLTPKEHVSATCFHADMTMNTAVNALNTVLPLYNDVWALHNQWQTQGRLSVGHYGVGTLIGVHEFVILVMDNEDRTSTVSVWDVGLDGRHMDQ